MPGIKSKLCSQPDYDHTRNNNTASVRGANTSTLSPVADLPNLVATPSWLRNGNDFASNIRNFDSDDLVSEVSYEADDMSISDSSFDGDIIDIFGATPGERG